MNDIKYQDTRQKTAAIGLTPKACSLLNEGTKELFNQRNQGSDNFS